jgi:hypothetical protein
MQMQEKAEAKIEKLRGQLEHSRSGRIKLNVGGSVFETTIAKLIKYPDTFFYAAFVSFSSGEPAPLDADGCYFIDRNGKHFGVILELLRKGKARLPANDGDADDLMEEVQYYMLDEPFRAALAADRGNVPSRAALAAPDHAKKQAHRPDFACRGGYFND